MRFRVTNFFAFNFISKLFEKIIHLSQNSSNLLSSQDASSQETEFKKNVNNFQKKYYSKIVFSCFYLIGFCNLFPIITMISAAHDLLKTDIDSQNNMTKRYGGKYDCNEISTGKFYFFSKAFT